MALEGTRLSFVHPVTKKLLDFRQPIPPLFRKLLKSTAPRPRAAKSPAAKSKKELTVNHIKSISTMNQQTRSFAPLRPSLSAVRASSWAYLSSFWGWGSNAQVIRDAVTWSRSVEDKSSYGEGPRLHCHGQESLAPLRHGAP